MTTILQTQFTSKTTLTVARYALRPRAVTKALPVADTYAIPIRLKMEQREKVNMSKMAYEHIE